MQEVMTNSSCNILKTVMPVFNKHTGVVMEWVNVSPVDVENEQPTKYRRETKSSDWISDTEVQEKDQLEQSVDMEQSRRHQS